ncbi:barstar family protein [Nitrospira moscoviensis]|uniref:Putative Ribonuclease inhibitor Barstar (Modular protein) n=1 Tax=Nitrospira moscoviensis TaxID=42253 RepID=A0A0K2GJ65_NITMO|nr:barstar family protein [Nitrospira moscoviensis]ALA60981.1 putative Ribonuclease inhibitor Barstar (Modular protein) [Nitrospira moscoviensis]
MPPRQNVHTHLQHATAPWSSLLVVPPGATAAALVKPPAGFALRRIEGKKCATPAGVFKEFARALDFPDYFGHNWDALEECLADLEWLPAKGYVVLITDAHHVIPDDEEEYETLLEVLSDAGEAWSKGHTADGRRAPFHVFFAVSERDKGKRKHWGLTELPPNDTAAKTARGSKRSGEAGRD